MPHPLDRFIRNIPDFPKPGIQFKDITPLLADPGALRAAVDGLADLVRSHPIDVVGAAEARGFLFGTPLALSLGVGFVPIRKPGKLPYLRVSQVYELEYGQDTLEMHADALRPGTRVLLVDDVLATGGTMKACCELVQSTGAHVAACAFLIELGFLEGRARLAPTEVVSLIRYP
ncbi:MAG: adenine phosphoribosyltransferase [Isosphaeraceae bacterium]|jgi:adenine phosphoribosyltransferase|nr:MAG: adenine phosphoribosyltransferase [Isosphaeraceae bacterium]